MSAHVLDVGKYLKAVTAMDFIFEKRNPTNIYIHSPSATAVNLHFGFVVVKKKNILIAILEHFPSNNLLCSAECEKGRAVSIIKNAA